VARSLNLSPDDWLWATWRPRTPRERPEPRRWDRQRALDRVAGITRSQRHLGIYWYTWEKLKLPVSLSREEAHFWFTAIVRSCGRKPRKGEELAQELEALTFDGELSVAEAGAALESLAVQTLPDSILPPLVNLFGVEELVSLLSWETLFGLRRRLYSMEVNVPFHTLLLPYLTEGEMEFLRETARPHIHPGAWPLGAGNRPLAQPPPAFCLAAQVGMHEELRALVERWPDDAFPGETWVPEVDGPQHVIFGLGDARQVETHMRRFRLKLRTCHHVAAWLAHTEYSALDLVRDSVQAAGNKEWAEELIAPLARVVAPEAAPVMLDLRLASKAPSTARRWLDEHPVETIAGLLPAIARRDKLADGAAEYLRGLKRQGRGALISELMSELPAGAADRAREEVLQHEERVHTPLDDRTTPEGLRVALADAAGGKPGPLPPWVEVTGLPPVLIGDLRLNDEQVGALLTALRRSDLEKPHPLIPALKAHADARSLDAFAWALCEAWLYDGAPSKQKWALMAVGLLGGDASAFKLAPLVRAWPGESQHQRAVLGLECLRAIGTDTALMQINGIAQKVPFRALKLRAQECIEAIAEARGMTRAELEDRIVPDCGLDERGTRVFDFGARHFTFALGPDLKPMVRDEAGAVRKDLPKPGSKDDADKSAQALEEWKLLKKQVREVAKVQAVRLEQAMVTGRRWTTGEFEALLVRHPLMTHLVRLLVWGGYDKGGGLVASFRVTEDATYAGPEDDDVLLDGLASVGIAHPLQLTEDDLATWGQVLADYELIPPFPQLGRPVYTLEAGEAEALELTRFRGRRVPAAAFVGTLERLQWQRGAPEDAGIVHEHAKPFLGAGVTAVIEYEGVPVGYMEGWEPQSVEKAFFVEGLYHPALYQRRGPALRLGEVDPVVMSETLADLEAVAARGG
jgi:hypothetical protein